MAKTLAINRPEYVEPANGAPEAVDLQSKIISQPQMQRILNAFAAGATIAQLVSEFRFSRPTINRILLANHMPLKRKLTVLQEVADDFEAERYALPAGHPNSWGAICMGMAWPGVK
jgi:hypothetical protein